MFIFVLIHKLIRVLFCNFIATSVAQKKINFGKRVEQSSNTIAYQLDFSKKNNKKKSERRTTIQ